MYRDYARSQARRPLRPRMIACGDPLLGVRSRLLCQNPAMAAARKFRRESFGRDRGLQARMLFTMFLLGLIYVILVGALFALAPGGSSSAWSRAPRPWSSSRPQTRSRWRRSTPTR